MLSVRKLLPESDKYRKAGSLTYIVWGVHRSVASAAFHAGSHGDAAAAEGKGWRV